MSCDTVLRFLADPVLVWWAVGAPCNYSAVRVILQLFLWSSPHVREKRRCSTRFWIVSAVSVGLQRWRHATFISYVSFISSDGEASVSVHVTRLPSKTFWRTGDRNKSDIEWIYISPLTTLHPNTNFSMNETVWTVPLRIWRALSEEVNCLCCTRTVLVIWQKSEMCERLM